MATFTDNPKSEHAYLFKGLLAADQMADKVWVIMRADTFDAGNPDVEVFVVADGLLKAGPTFSGLADLLCTPFVWDGARYVVAP